MMSFRLVVRFHLAIRSSTAEIHILDTPVAISLGIVVTGGNV